MRDFKISLRGRVKNFSLPENKSLMPLFEAVVNSLQAIEERKKITAFDGIISIKIDREQTISNEILGSIEDVIITDNGIGFNDIISIPLWNLILNTKKKSVVKALVDFRG